MNPGYLIGAPDCEARQKQFTGRSCDLWNAEEYKAFGKVRGNRCARATGRGTRWVAQRLAIKLIAIETKVMLRAFGAVVGLVVQNSVSRGFILLPHNHLTGQK